MVNPPCGSLASSLPAICTATTVPNPQTRTNVSPRIDYQLTPSNTFTARYQYFENTQQNASVGQNSNQITLESYGYNVDSIEHQVQLSDTQVFGPKVVNETRFQFLHQSNENTPVNTTPAISIPGVLQFGGNTIGHSMDDQNHYEIQNYTSYTSGNHSMRFGARIRVSQADTVNPGNFNGSFTYPTLAAYLNNQPNQFSIATGQPAVSDTYTDAGLYVEDDWKLRPNLTVSYGLRYETQSDINDHHDFAPRVGIAWGLGGKGKTPSTVIRGGFGIFYDRFPQNLVLQATRLDGTLQQSFVIESPSFGPSNIPPSFAGSGAPLTVYRIDPNFRAPYVMQAAIGVERQLTRAVKLSLTYLNSRGVHQLFTNNINAPFPGTFPANPVCPMGCSTGNVYEYQSGGIFKQNQLITNLNMRYGPSLTLFGFYSLSFADSDTTGAGSFPTNPYDPSVDYGRSPFDVRNRLFFGGNFGAPFGLRLSPFIAAQSGSPYNLTIPENILGTSIFNARPGLAAPSSACPSVSATNAFCFFIPTPGQAYAPIPVNFGEGPAQWSVNMRVSKTIGLGPRLEQAGGRGGRGGRGGERGGFGGFGGGPGGMFGGGATDHRYSLTFSAMGRNIFNHPNLAPPVGVLSPGAFAGTSTFGQSIALSSGGGPGGGGGGFFGSQANVRRIDLQVQFTF